MHPIARDAVALHEILAEFPTLVGDWTAGPWTWDPRFACPTAVVDRTVRDASYALIRQELPCVFDHTRHARVPEPVSRIVSATGGLRPGQCVFTDYGRFGEYRYALWWPWTNGATVSVRIGVTSE